ncbi:MAG: transporter [Pseudonocardia sp.]|nr:transporter [Pseudonocardia sp.]MDT7616154.1 transporter, putative metabolite:H+ symporter [Pseudonocardiales bacterium]
MPMSSSLESPSDPRTLTIGRAGARLDRLPTGPFHRRVLLVAVVAFVFEIGDQSATGLVAASLTTHLDTSLTGIAFAVSAMYLGLLVGSLVAGQAGDRYGRRSTLAWGMAATALFSALAALSPNITTLVILRFLTGIGLGAIYIGIVVYLTELFPARRRGLSLAVGVAIGTIGSVLLTVLARVVVPMGENGWRIVYAVGLLGLLAVPACRRLPESPRWLLARGRADEAESVLERIEEETTAKVGPLPEPETSDAAASAHEARRQPTSALFGSTLLRSTVMLMIVWICYSAVQQVTTTWTPTILVLRGFTQAEALSLTSLIVLGSLAGSIAAIFIADRLPRRAGLVAFTLIAAVAALCFGFVTNLALLIAAGFAIYFFSGGASPLINAYMAEEFPTDLRARGSSVAFSTGRLTNVIAPFTIAAVLASLGYHAIAIGTFTAWALIAVAVLVLGRRRSRKADMVEEI